jgi:GNAT superfamily N-acetyltransferase
VSCLLENFLEQVPNLVEFWNCCTSEPFFMDARLMREHLEYPGAIVLVDQKDARRGVLWGRHGSLGATLDAVMVLPRLRRQGVGRSLVESFRQALEPNVSWRFGGGNHHFVPGLPESLAEAHGFFSALGLVTDWHAYDLIWRAPEAPRSDPQPSELTSWDVSTYRLLTATEIGELAELMGQFGKRWQDDTERRCQALKAGRPEEIMGAFLQNRLVGFCHIWTGKSQTLGPSTFWLDRQGDAWGGIGPLGVHPEQRGRGLGAGVVEASMAYLRRQGKQRIGVDWTGLPKFYERCGFTPWISYRGYHPG